MYLGTTPVRVQIVRTEWTKASRGGKAAGVRNSCPVGFRWPSDDPVWHEVRMRETEGFAPRHQRHGSIAAVPAADAEPLSLRAVENGVSLLPQVSSFWMPLRHRRPPRAAITTGQWIRWQLNYRHGLANDWAYGMVTINVACGSGLPDDLFLGEPSRHVDELASLR